MVNDNKNKQQVCQQQTWKCQLTIAFVSFTFSTWLIPCYISTTYFSTKTLKLAFNNSLIKS